jgi:hypothetical protein
MSDNSKTMDRETFIKNYQKRKGCSRARAIRKFESVSAKFGLRLAQATRATAFRATGSSSGGGSSGGGSSGDSSTPQNTKPPELLSQPHETAKIHINDVSWLRRVYMYPPYYVGIVSAPRAHQAGLRNNDIIIEINGHPVPTFQPPNLKEEETYFPYVRARLARNPNDMEITVARACPSKSMCVIM